jgi:hypothetical protein
MADSPWPPVTLVLPLSGGDSVDGLAEAWASLEPYALPPYPGTLDIVLLAMGDDSSAVKRAQRHVARLGERGRAARLMATNPGGPNRKAAQLAQFCNTMAKDHRGGLVLSVDSDVVPASVDLQGLVRLQQQQRAGAVWQAVVPLPCDPPPKGRASYPWGDRLAEAVRAGSGHAFPLLAALDGHSLVGKAMLYAPEAVRLTGGWEASIPFLGDDVALSQRLWASGYTVHALAQPPAYEARRGQTVGEALGRLTRWTVIMLAQRPHMAWTCPLYLIALPCQLALWALSFVAGAPRFLCALGALVSVLTRLGLGRLARRSSGGQATWSTCAVDAVLADGALLACFAKALCARRVRWHGRSLPVAKRAAPSGQ